MSSFNNNNNNGDICSLNYFDIYIHIAQLFLGNNKLVQLLNSYLP